MTGGAAGDPVTPADARRGELPLDRGLEIEMGAIPSSRPEHVRAARRDDRRRHLVTDLVAAWTDRRPDPGRVRRGAPETRHRRRDHASHDASPTGVHGRDFAVRDEDDRHTVRSDHHEREIALRRDQGVPFAAGSGARLADGRRMHLAKPGRAFGPGRPEGSGDRLARRSPHAEKPDLGIAGRARPAPTSGAELGRAGGSGREEGVAFVHRCILGDVRRCGRLPTMSSRGPEGRSEATRPR